MGIAMRARRPSRFLPELDRLAPARRRGLVAVVAFTSPPWR
jgi:hypothetical protein